MLERRANDQRINEIQKDIAEINLKFAVLMEQVQGGHTRIMETVDKHEETLYGNGHPGLTTLLSNIDSTLSSHVKTEEKVWDRLSADTRFNSRIIWLGLGGLSVLQIFLKLWR